jgi:predicted lipid carrier protein YhbT
MQQLPLLEFGEEGAQIGKGAHGTAAGWVHASGCSRRSGASLRQVKQPVWRTDYRGTITTAGAAMRLPKALTLCLAPLPLGLVQVPSALLFRRVLARHPRLFDRLGEHARKRFGFVPTDLPFAYEVLPSGPSIQVVRPHALLRADATISGPIVLLLALLEGRVDGDALFFARQLEISGDTEAILALRNALDDCDLDLPRAVGDLAGPLALPVQRGCELLRDRVLLRRRA